MFLYSRGSYMLIVLIYVDDILVTRNHDPLITDLISSLHSQFSLKDLGALSYFLGIEVTCTSTGLLLCQHKYITDLLHRAEMIDCKPYHTPMVAGTPLSVHDGEPLPDPTTYRNFVGALQYCTLTRPDISFLVNHLC